MLEHDGVSSETGSRIWDDMDGGSGTNVTVVRRPGKLGIEDPGSVDANNTGGGGRDTEAVE